MESVALYEKLHESIVDIMEGNEPAYGISIAITKTWEECGSPLEKELLTQFEISLKNHISYEMNEAYRATKHQEGRPEFTDFCKSRLSRWKKYNSKHASFMRVLAVLASELSSDKN